MKRLILAALTLLLAQPAQAQLLGVLKGPGSAGPVMMVTPLLFASGTANNPSATAINWTPTFGGSGSNNIGTTAAAKPDTWPVAGTISNLRVYFQTQPGNATGSYDVGLSVGGTKQTLVCNIPFNSNTCSDTTHSISIAVGNLVAWFICPSNTATCTAGAAPVAQTTPLQISATFTSTVGQESPLIAGGLGTTASTTAINYTGFGQHGGWNATENVLSTVMPTAGSVDKLAIYTGAPGTGASRDWTVYKNGVATTLTCTVTHPATTCTDVTVGHAVALVAGDTISLATCPSNTATCTAGVAPTAVGASASVRWIPTTQNLALILDTPTVLPGTGASALFMNGAGASGSATGTESTFPNLVPDLPGGTTWSFDNLYIAQCPGPGGAVTRTETLRLGTAGGALSSQTLAAVVAAGTTACPTYSTQTATGGVAGTAGQWFTWQTQNSGTGAALTTIKIGATVRIQ